MSNYNVHPETHVCLNRQRFCGGEAVKQGESSQPPYFVALYACPKCGWVFTVGVDPYTYKSSWW